MTTVSKRWHKELRCFMDPQDPRVLAQDAEQEAVKAEERRVLGQRILDMCAASERYRRSKAEFQAAAWERRHGTPWPGPR